MRLSNIRIDAPEPGNKQFWFGVYTDDGGTEKRPYGFVSKDELKGLITKMRFAMGEEATR